MGFYADKTILVAGGTGSIGSSVVKELLTHAPKSVRILSRNAEKQYWMREEHKGRQTRFILGDICYKERLPEILHGCDYVFNCAALKHVDMAEYNVDEAARVNISGMKNLLDAARAVGASAFMQLSTDKVANVQCVMAATKLTAERIARTYWRSRETPKVVTVRLGNVVGSSCSLGQRISKCVKRGVPYPITDERMRRFFISSTRAANFIVRALAEGESGEVWVPEMTEEFIVDKAAQLAAVCVQQLGKVGEYDPAKYTLVGARPNENLRESLWTEEEAGRLKEKRGEYKDAWVIPRT